MKASVHLASTTPIDLTATAIRDSIHWPGPVEDPFTHERSNCSQDFWEYPDDQDHILMLDNAYLTTGNRRMSMGFVWTPSVGHSSATTTAVKMEWLFNGAS